MKVFFTSGIKSTDSYFDFLIDVKRINIKDLILQKKVEVPGLKLNKFQVIAEYIQNTEKDVMIGNVVNTREDFKNLKRELELRGAWNRVYKVFLKENDSYSKYKNIYSEHSKWLDYSPEYVKAKQDEHNIELKELAVLIKKEEINFEFIK